jgi:hypothetical protein
VTPEEPAGQGCHEDRGPEGFTQSAIRPMVSNEHRPSPAAIIEGLARILARAAKRKAEARTEDER